MLNVQVNATLSFNWILFWFYFRDGIPINNSSMSRLNIEDLPIVFPIWSANDKINTVVEIGPDNSNFAANSTSVEVLTLDPETEEIINESSYEEVAINNVQLNLMPADAEEFLVQTPSENVVANNNETEARKENSGKKKREKYKWKASKRKKAYQAGKSYVSSRGKSVAVQNYKNN